MSAHHLEKGSPLPEVNPDLLRIYSMRYCPYAERTRLVLAHKKIPHEIVNVNLKNKPEWLFQRNPLGLVPVIEYKGHYIYESAVCDEFLEDLSDANALLPSCAFKRAAARLFMTLSDNKVIPLRIVWRAPTQEKREEELAKWQSEGLRQLEDHLANSGESFFGGDKVGLPDLHIWPFFERIPAANDLFGIDILPAASFPRLNAWIAVMENVDAVKQCQVSTDEHRRFLELSLAGKPNYDFDE